MLLLTTCKKQWKKTTVEGHLTEFYTGKPIANAKLILYGLTDKNIDNNSTDKIVETTTTDANGYFTFKKFNAYKSQEDNYNIYIDSFDLLLVVNDKVKQYLTITKGKKNNLGLKAITRCDITINFSNQASNYSFDSLCFKYDYSNEKVLKDYYSNNWQCRFGYQTVITGNSFSAGILVNYYWRTYKNNTSTNYSGSINVQNDTTINISY
jgi:5-hydroxyisourate hydrolase-like protein (transthyretin family)